MSGSRLASLSRPLGCTLPAALVGLLVALSHLSPTALVCEPGRCAGLTLTQQAEPLPQLSHLLTATAPCANHSHATGSARV